MNRSVEEEGVFVLAQDRRAVVERFLVSGVDDCDGDDGGGVVSDGI